jgi:hypothetical protein
MHHCYLLHFVRTTVRTVLYLPVPQTMLSRGWSVNYYGYVQCSARESTVDRAKYSTSTVVPSQKNL